MYRHVEVGQQRPNNEVSAEHIVEKLAKNRRIELTADQVELDHPITEIGEHVVNIQLERGYEANLLVQVEPR
jgi:ribosomal protein L9